MQNILIVTEVQDIEFEASRMFQNLVVAPNRVKLTCTERVNMRKATWLNWNQVAVFFLYSTGRERRELTVGFHPAV